MTRAPLILLIVGACSIDRGRTVGPTEVPLASALECAEGEVVAWEGGAWACATPQALAYEAFGSCDEGDKVIGVESTTGSVICSPDADTDTDSLAEVETPACAEGQVLSRASGAWACADDRDTDTDTDSLAEVGGCKPGQVLGRQGGGWGCLTPPEASYDGFGQCSEQGTRLGGVDKDGRVVCAPDSDGLAGIECADGVVLQRQDGAWSCGASDSALGSLVAEVAAARNGEDTLDDLLDDVEERLGVLEDAKCPPGFEYDDDDGNGFEICWRMVSAQRDVMVRVGSFWIDRYESSICSEPCQVGQETGGDEFGEEPATCWACSWAAGVATGWASWFVHAQWCANAGKRLCTSAEWQAAASGTPDPVAGGPGLACAVDPDDPSHDTGEYPECVSRFGAYDMTGNRWEWVADWRGMDRLGFGTTFGTDDAGYDVAIAVRRAEAQDGPSSFPAAALRGGGIENGGQAGIFTFSLGVSPSAGGGSFSARCCVGGI